jgi:hypothetical protein
VQHFEPRMADLAVSDSPADWEDVVRGFADRSPPRGCRQTRVVTSSIAS